MPLTDTQVRQARPKEKGYKLRDERGLLLLVRPTGAKWWRLRYKIQGRENMLSLGVYPDVSLSMARDRRHDRPPHEAALPIGELLLDIDSYDGRFLTRCALRLEPLIFPRSFELRNLEWKFVDFESAELRIPRVNMKGKRSEHVVPLAVQALAVLKELHAATGRGRYVFPKLGNPSKTMSENTINDALHPMGYTGAEMTGHAFRTVASTILNESGEFRPDAIERQLSHQEDDEVRGAYNGAEYLAECHRTMR